jgi:Ca2+-transporting ATPase
MGQTGTDVAKEAADIVLADDNFATIAVAVREGRKLFENLRKAVRYYLAVKVALVSSSLIAVLLQLPVPFSPIQIIVTELFMDLGASVAFTAERAEGDVMARPPRDAKRPFMDGAMQAGIFAGGLSLCGAVMAAYLWALSRGAAPAHAQSLAFVTWMIGHVLLALHMRSERQPLRSLGVFSNWAMVAWGVGAVALALLSANVPVLSETLKMTPLSLREWVFAVIAPLLTTSWWEIWKLASWGKRGSEALGAKHQA